MLNRRIVLLETVLWRLEHSCIYTSLMIAEEEASSREDTVEIVAAIGPMMVMPAQKGSMVPMIVSGVMLSTLPPAVSLQGIGKHALGKDADPGSDQSHGADNYGADNHSVMQGFCVFVTDTADY
jgi:hypothetical protein